MEENDNPAAEEEKPSLEVMIETLVAHLEVLNITQMRTYDVLSSLLHQTAPEAWEYLSNKHEAGGLHNGFPYMSEDPWSSDKEADK